MRWIFGIIIGLVVGLFVGIVVGGSSAEAAWGFLGVLVGAGVTLFVEQVRTEAERQKGRSAWKLAALARLGEATDELERAFGGVLTVRLEDINRNDRFRTVHQLDPKVHALAQGLRQHTLVSGPYLGKDLSKAATTFRDATGALAVFVPEWIDDVDAPLDQANKDHLRDELTEIGGARVKLFEKMEELRNTAVMEALDS